MTPITNKIVDDLQAKADQLGSDILNGRCKDYAQYLSKVEKRKGILDAIEVCREKDRTDEDDE